MARANSMMTKFLGLVVLAGAAGAGGCAASAPVFSQQQVRDWALRSEHLRQLNRMIHEPWPDEVAAQERAAGTVGLWW